MSWLLPCDFESAQPMKPLQSHTAATLLPSLHQWVLGMVLLMGFWVGPVLAQGAGGMADLDSINAGGQAPTDLAKIIMRGILGPMFDSPLTSGIGATTLFGVVFLAFNVVVFSAGVVWATYGVIAGVVQTAHEGVVLGKRLSAVWMPVRMATGIGALVPVFGGFSLSQVVMILATSWGITFGNYAFNQGMDAMNNFAPLINVSAVKAPRGQSAVDLGYAIFEQRLCELDYQAKQRAMAAQGVDIPVNDQLTQRNFIGSIPNASSLGAGHVLGTNNDPTACLAVGINRKLLATRSADSAFGFRVDSVNYEQIALNTYSRYYKSWPNFYTSMRSLADDWVRQSGTSNERLSVPEDAIVSNSLAFTSYVQDAAKNQETDAGAIRDEAFTKMREFGFFGLGSYYATTGEVNAAILEASNAVEFVIVGPGEEAQKRINASSGEFSKYQQAFYDRRKSQAVASSTSEAKGLCDKLGMEVSTGNCSLGQSILRWALGGMTAGSGDGGAGTDMRIIDPIIAAKNIGDYMMTVGQTMLVVGAVANADKSGSSMLGTVVGVAKKAAGFFSGGLTDSLLSVLPMIGGLMIAVGALLALYIPMVPFINWVSALVQYVSIVVESLAAAPLWAFAHLQADGEGMGSRTERGYLYLLMLLFKPILMVIGFLAACGLVILLGSAVLWLFMPAVANSQGNSMTGLVSIIGYLVMFFLLMNIIIQGLFNLIQELSDDTIGWIGNVGKSMIGRDMEGKASNMFVMGGRFGGTVAQTAMSGSGARKAMQAAGGGGGKPTPGGSVKR